MIEWLMNRVTRGDRASMHRHHRAMVAIGQSRSREVRGCPVATQPVDAGEHPQAGL